MTPIPAAKIQITINILKRSALRFTILCLLSCLPFVAMAAEPVLPPDVDSGRIEQRLERTPEPPPGDILSPLAKPAEVKVPPGSEKVFIVVKSLTVSGETVYSPEEINGMAGDLVGKKVSLADIYQLAALIENKYRSDGYILARVQVAATGKSDGNVRIKITEGKVSGVKVRTAGDLNDGIVLGILENIRAINPFNIQQLERQALLLNDLYGVKAKTTLTPGNEPGAVGIDVLVEDSGAKRFQTSASFDDYGSRYLGPLEANLTEEIAAVALPHDKLTLSAFATIPTDELKFGSASYLTPINSSGTSVGFSDNYGDTAPGYNLKSKDITGNSDSFAATVLQNVIRSREQNLNLSADLTAKEATSDIFSHRLYDDRLRTAKLQASYDNVDAYGGANAATLSTTQGVDMLGASRTGSDELSRAEGHSGYTKFEMTLTRSQSLPADFSGLVSFAGQYALSPLLSSEQFGYGGQSFGRAYDPSQITGDDGAAGLVELRYGGLPVYESVSSQPYGFYDIGKVWNIHGEDETGASLGAGMRFNYLTAANANFFVAKPLTRGVNDPVSGNEKSLRYLFSLGCVF